MQLLEGTITNPAEVGLKSESPTLIFRITSVSGGCVDGKLPVAYNGGTALIDIETIEPVSVDEDRRSCASCRHLDPIDVCRNRKCPIYDTDLNEVKSRFFCSMWEEAPN